MRNQQVSSSWRLWQSLRRLWSDETGGEALEFALVTGLIVIGVIGLVQKVGTKVLARWSSLNSSM